MSDEDAHAIGSNPALAALETAAVAAIAVDGAGAIVWTNAAGRPLSSGALLDEAARRTIARIASSGSEGLARLRVGSGESAEALTFRSRRIRLADGARGVLFETLSPAAFPAVAEIETPEAPSDRDVAAEEGADRGAAADKSAPLSWIEALDPRRRIAPEPATPEPVVEAVAAHEGPAAPEPDKEPAPSVGPDDRFVFEIDQNGRIAFLSADLARIVGASAAGAAGRDWREVSDELGLDPEKLVEAALARRSGWSDLSVSWPTDDGKRAPFSLSALPMFDRGRTFVGFRGLGHLQGAPVPAASTDAGQNSDAGEPIAAAAAPGAKADDTPGQPVIEETAAADVPAPEISTPVAETAPHKSVLESLAGLSVIGAPILAARSTADEQTPAALLDEREPATASKTDPASVAPENETEAPQDGAPAAVEGASDEPAAVEQDNAPAPTPIREEPPAIISAPRAIEPYPVNVVPLRDASAQPPRGLPRASLSTMEESAFDEIARRLRGLGARVSDTPDLPAGHGPETAEIRPTPESRDWTLDDVEGRAPTGSRADDAFRLLDRLPVGALVLRAGEIAYANRATLDMAGHRDLGGLVARGSSDLFAEPLPRDDAAPSTLRLRAEDGLEIEVEARLSTISWQGAPATLVALKRAEGMSVAASDALQREREVSEILDTATDGVLTLDGAGRILSVNRSAEALFGFDEASVIGSLFTLSLAPESRRTAYDYLDSLKANGVGAVLNDGREVLGLARQGGAIPLYMTMGRIGSPQEARYCAVLRDITHWKKAEEELLAAKRQAERANAQKSEFLARVSHEIRTPLNAIIGFSEVMMEERLGPIGNPRYKDYLRDIHISGEHLTGLVNDLLDLSKVESGLLKLEFASVDLNEIVSQAAALLQTQANRDHVIIRTSLARNLPSVLADRRSARQIMTNLVSNAVKFSRPGGQVIVATAYTEGGQAVIRVRDAGGGMSKKEIARALEPFRALPSSDGDSGSGIGLPLTKALIEANEAAFDIQSEVGEGTLVEVTFPAARVLAG